MARVGFSSLNVNQMAGNKGMIAVCLRSRQQERSRNGPLDPVETHNNQQLQRQQQAVPLQLSNAHFWPNRAFFIFLSGRPVEQNIVDPNVELIFGLNMYV